MTITKDTSNTLDKILDLHDKIVESGAAIVIEFSSYDQRSLRDSQHILGYLFVRNRGILKDTYFRELSTLYGMLKEVLISLVTDAKEIPF